MQNIGKPANRSMSTKKSRLISDPNTIWALDSGVVSRMLNVWASFSWVMAAAVNTGASRHIMASWARDAHSNMREAPLARSANDDDAPPDTENVMTTTSRTRR